ncbi:F-box protein [Phanerochaete sordida]|uniref:F-box protein n=1 Tax=Phanerochaete sordida TaxID=48140 RepID=A0A9P3GT31_9APHY|nr:F-box protein [Phanerochaete sordida]
MNQLPVELLLEIFQDCLDSTRSDSHAQQLLRLQRVCLQWYTVIENRSRLWAVIYLATQPPRYVEKALQRSRNDPLWVETAAEYAEDEDEDSEPTESSLYPIHIREQAEALMGILKTEMHRIRVLVVENWQVQDVVRDNLHATLDAPALEVLRLPAGIPSDSAWFSILMSAPKLQDLEVGGFDDLKAWSSLGTASLQSLRKLILSSDYYGEAVPTLPVILHLLRSVPRLEILTLWSMNPDREQPWAATDEITSLPKLRKLVVEQCGAHNALMLLRSLVLPPGCIVRHAERYETDVRLPPLDYPRQASATLDVAATVGALLQGAGEFYFGFERRSDRVIVRIADQDAPIDMTDTDNSLVRVELPPHPDFVRDFCARLPLSRVVVLCLEAICRCERWEHARPPTFSKADEVRGLHELCAMMPSVRELRLESTFCDCVAAAYVSLVAAAPPDLTTLRIVVDEGYDLHLERRPRVFVEDLLHTLRQRELAGYPIYNLSARSKDRRDGLDREIMDEWSKRGDEGGRCDFNMDISDAWRWGEAEWYDNMDCS